MDLWKAGEEEALNRLNNFLAQKAINYSKDRNDPIIDGTSRISPYLALGVISPKRCILEALKANNFEFTSGHIGITKWIDEIVWREFYRNIMFSFPRVIQVQTSIFQNQLNGDLKSLNFRLGKMVKPAFQLLMLL